MMYENLSRRIVLAIQFLICAVFVLVPIVIYPASIFPYLTLKTTLFYAITEIAFFLYLIVLVLDKRFSVRRNIIVLAFALLLLVKTISSIFGIDPSFSFWSSSVRMDGILTLIHLFMLFITIIAVIKDRKSLNILLWVSVSTSILVVFTVYLGSNGLNILRQLLGGPLGQFGYSGGLIGNDSYTSVYMLFNIFLIVYLYFNSVNKYAKGVLLSFLLVAICSPLFLNFAVLSGRVSVASVLNNPLLLIGTSRAASVSIVIGLFFAFLIYCLKSVRVQFRKYIKYLIAVLGLSLLFILVLTFIPGNVFHTKFNQMTGGYRSVYQKQSINGWAERPLLGFGEGNFSYVNTKFFSPEAYDDYPNKVELNADKAHNIIFDTLSENGLLGLLVLIFFIYSVMRFMFLSRNIPWQTKTIFTGLFMAYFIQMLTFFNVLASAMMLVLVLATVIILDNLANEKKSELGTTDPSNKSQIIAIILIPVALLVTLRYFVVLPMQEINNNYYYYNLPPNERIHFPISELDTSAFGSGDEESYIFAYVLNRYENALPKVKTLKDPSVYIEDLENMVAIINQSSFKGLLVVKNNILFKIYMLEHKISGDQSLINKMKYFATQEINTAPAHPIGYMNYVQALEILPGNTKYIEPLYRRIIELNPKLALWVEENRKAYNSHI